MSLDPRELLATQQAELVRALTGLSGPPEGFLTGHVRAAALALARKRARSVARAWPSLVEALGQEFEPCFALYTAEAPLPRRGGPLADGRNFVRVLDRQGKLSDRARLDALAVDLRYVSRSAGLVVRRGPSLAIALLRHPRQLVLAVRWPGQGVWRIAIPLGRRTPHHSSSAELSQNSSGVGW
ncbi:hypothetical protein [Singulisphaera acidiphila]|uniref:hypothetical protein n=1 Tax=Singulisphaera acidiphila TaxID=466153 RepID=UPI0002474EA5|nr:hypothetical protein [Singulisphaera acidiphila]